jgi:hypothetical protein
MTGTQALVATKSAGIVIVSDSCAGSETLSNQAVTLSQNIKIFVNQTACDDMTTVPICGLIAAMETRVALIYGSQFARTYMRFSFQSLFTVPGGAPCAWLIGKSIDCSVQVAHQAKTFGRNLAGDSSMPCFTPGTHNNSAGVMLEVRMDVAIPANATCRPVTNELFMLLNNPIPASGTSVPDAAIECLGGGEVDVLGGSILPLTKTGGVKSTVNTSIIASIAAVSALAVLGLVFLLWRRRKHAKAREAKLAHLQRYSIKGSDADSAEMSGAVTEWRASMRPGQVDLIDGQGGIGSMRGGTNPSGDHKKRPGFDTNGNTYPSFQDGKNGMDMGAQSKMPRGNGRTRMGQLFASRGDDFNNGTVGDGSRGSSFDSSPANARGPRNKKAFGPGLVAASSGIADAFGPGDDASNPDPFARPRRSMKDDMGTSKRAVKPGHVLFGQSPAARSADVGSTDDYSDDPADPQNRPRSDIGDSAPPRLNKKRSEFVGGHGNGNSATDDLPGRFGVVPSAVPFQRPRSTVFSITRPKIAHHLRKQFAAMRPSGFNGAADAAGENGPSNRTMRSLKNAASQFRKSIGNSFDNPLLNRSASGKR